MIKGNCCRMWASVCQSVYDVTQWLGSRLSLRSDGRLLLWAMGKRAPGNRWTCHKGFFWAPLVHFSLTCAPFSHQAHAKTPWGERSWKKNKIKIIGTCLPECGKTRRHGKRLWFKLTVKHCILFFYQNGRVQFYEVYLEMKIRIGY